MVYVTGDMHGEWERFKSKDMKKLKKGDVLMICGDFGFLWDNSRKEKQILQKMEALPFTVAFLDGCHENYDLLLSYPEETWNGGKIHRIAPNIIHLMRGQIFTIENRTFFTFGGGHSQDYEYRTTETWWKQERPTRKEVETAVANLQKYYNKVDYILTHEPPAMLKDCLGVDVAQRLEIHAFFADMVKACNYRKWFFGKCHIDKYIPVKFFAVFAQVLPVTVKDTDL
ncbi:MAG: metallophosphoesterase [Oscillospiraceae bacterium]|nr:metallophosphoesterase [Oscillospiraceae bacterium]